jgi:hypothetical protein
MPKACFEVLQINVEHDEKIARRNTDESVRPAYPPILDEFWVGRGVFKSVGGVGALVIPTREDGQLIAIKEIAGVLVIAYNIFGVYQSTVFLLGLGLVGASSRPSAFRRPV